MKESEDGRFNGSDSNSEILKNSAGEYFNLGFNIVPALGKQPIVKWEKWLEQRQTLEEFEALPWAKADGFGVICGRANSQGLHLAVVDYDVKNTSLEAQAKGREALKHMPITRIERTPSGGQHWIYLSKVKPRSLNFHHETAALELLGEKKLCFMAPSSGYRRLNDNLPTVVDNVEALFLQALEKVGVPIHGKPKAPEGWFGLETVEAEAYKGPTPPCVKGLLKGVDEGLRNEAAIRLSSYLVNFKRLSPEKAFGKLREWNRRNRPPLPENELEKVLKSAVEHGYVYGCKDDLLRRFCKTPFECPLKAGRLTLDELLELRLKQLDMVKVHPLIDFNPQTGLTIGIFLAASNEAVIFKAEKPIRVQFGATSIQNPFAESISVIKPKWCKLRENWERQILSILKEYQEKGEIEFPAQNTVFKELSSKIYNYFYHSDKRVYTLIACWIIATYFHPIFTYFPILNVQGQRETGKTTLLAILEQSCWNPTGRETALREAPLFRTIQDSRPTYLVDVTALSRKNPSYIDVIDVCESGTEKGGVVKRIQPKTERPVEWRVYGPKAVASREELPFTVKCIRIITEKAPNKEYSERRHMLEFDEKWPQIVNMLLKAAIKYWSQVYEAYRSLKPTDKLYGRAFNYWASILAVCKVFAPESYDGLSALAEEMVKQEQISDLISLAEDAILSWACNKSEKEKTILLADLTREVQAYCPAIKSWRTVHSALTNLHIHKDMYKTTRGLTVRVDVERAKEKAVERGIKPEEASEGRKEEEKGSTPSESDRRLSISDLKSVYWADEPLTEKKCCICGQVEKTNQYAETFKGEKLPICEDCALKFQAERDAV